MPTGLVAYRGRRDVMACGLVVTAGAGSKAGKVDVLGSSEYSVVRA